MGKTRKDQRNFTKESDKKKKLDPYRRKKVSYKDEN